MRNIHIDNSGSDQSYQHAALLATDAARENRMQDPTVMAWHAQSGQGMSPGFEGGNPDTWWEKYGEGNGGRLEVSVGDEYAFVMMDTRGYETVHEIPLRNLQDSEGRQYVCLTPMLGGSSTPTPEACSPLDEWTGNQY